MGHGNGSPDSAAGLLLAADLLVPRLCCRRCLSTGLHEVDEQVLAVMPCTLKAGTAIAASDSVRSRPLRKGPADVALALVLTLLACLQRPCWEIETMGVAGRQAAWPAPPARTPCPAARPYACIIPIALFLATEWAGKRSKCVGPLTCVATLLLGLTLVPVASMARA